MPLEQALAIARTCHANEGTDERRALAALAAEITSIQARPFPPPSVKDFQQALAAADHPEDYGANDMMAALRILAENFRDACKKNEALIEQTEKAITDSAAVREELEQAKSHTAKVSALTGSIAERLHVTQGNTFTVLQRIDDQISAHAAEFQKLRKKCDELESDNGKIRAFAKTMEDQAAASSECTDRIREDMEQLQTKYEAAKNNMQTTAAVLDEVRAAVFSALLKANLNASVREGTATIELINELGRTIAGALESYREAALARDTARKELDAQARKHEAMGEEISNALGRHRGTDTLINGVKRAAFELDAVLRILDELNVPTDAGTLPGRMGTLADSYRKADRAAREAFNLPACVPLAEVIETMGVRLQHAIELSNLFEEHLTQTRESIMERKGGAR